MLFLAFMVLISGRFGPQFCCWCWLHGVGRYPFVFHADAPIPWRTFRSQASSRARELAAASCASPTVRAHPAHLSTCCIYLPQGVHLRPTAPSPARAVAPPLTVWLVQEQAWLKARAVRTECGPTFAVSLSPAEVAHAYVRVTPARRVRRRGDACRAPPSRAIQDRARARRVLFVWRMTVHASEPSARVRRARSVGPV